MDLIRQQSDGQATVSELSDIAQLNKGTVSRLLATLRETGWVYQDPIEHSYRLAGKALSLSNGQSPYEDLRAFAVTPMTELRDEWDEAVHLGVIEGGEVVYIERIESTATIRVVAVIGQRLPVATTALGRAYMSALSPERQAAMLDSIPLVERTPNSIVAPELLLEDLEAAATRGYAIDKEANDLHVICVGAPIVNVQGQPVGALSVSGPTFRMADRYRDIGEGCRATAQQISRTLGSTG